MNAEGSDPKCNNPLNTTLVMDMGETDWNSVHVKCYPTHEIGMYATLKTLSQSDYQDIVTALYYDNGPAFKQALGQSPWGTNTDNIVVEAPVAEVYQVAAVAPVSGTVLSQSNSIDTSGNDNCSFNALSWLNANNGALRHFTINPGQSISFNELTGSPEYFEYRVCAGVPGGNACNLASRYGQAARDAGLQIKYQDHGADLGADGVNVVIWNEGGARGGQDLEIFNTLSYPVTFDADSETVVRVSK